MKASRPTAENKTVKFVPILPLGTNRYFTA